MKIKFFLLSSTAFFLNSCITFRQGDVQFNYSANTSEYKIVKDVTGSSQNVAFAGITKKRTRNLVYLAKQDFIKNAQLDSNQQLTNISTDIYKKFYLFPITKTIVTIHGNVVEPQEKVIEINEIYGHKLNDNVYVRNNIDHGIGVITSFKNENCTVKYPHFESIEADYADLFTSRGIFKYHDKINAVGDIISVKLNEKNNSDYHQEQAIVIGINQNEALTIFIKDKTYFVIDIERINQ